MSGPARMDAVLPLTLRDADRAKILLASLEKYFDGMGTLHVVVPDSQRSELQARLPSVERFGVQVHSELSVVPELARFSRAGGWYKQQLIKLSIFEHVETDFYMTFDADVVATRPVSPQRLCPLGKAPCYVIEEDLHPRWYRRTAHLIQRPLRRQGVVHNVTPAVLARDGVAALAEHFGQRFAAGDWARGLRAWRQRWTRLRAGSIAELAGWRLFLAAALPWTEYALYYSFLEAYDRFDEWHEQVDTCIYDIDRSVWKADGDEFDHWQPAPLFEGEGPAVLRGAPVEHPYSRRSRAQQARRLCLDRLR